MLYVNYFSVKLEKKYQYQHIVKKYEKQQSGLKRKWLNDLKQLALKSGANLKKKF